MCAVEADSESKIWKRGKRRLQLNRAKQCGQELAVNVGVFTLKAKCHFYFNTLSIKTANIHQLNRPLIFWMVPEVIQYGNLFRFEFSHQKS